jgi:hypothetical protein
MGVFEGGPVERRVMEKVGCMDYSITAWEPVREDVYQRQVHYRIDRKSTRYEGEVMTTQQKSPLPDKNGWLIEEVVTFEGIPVGECFNVRDFFLAFNFLFYYVHLNVRFIFELYTMH